VFAKGGIFKKNFVKDISILVYLSIIDTIHSKGSFLKLTGIACLAIPLPDHFGTYTARGPGSDNRDNAPNRTEVLRVIVFTIKLKHSFQIDYTKTHIYS
jgi:hypothetical protein